MTDYFVVERRGPIVTITFNRPEKRHPLNEEVMLELERRVAAVRDDAELRVMVLTSTGNTFSAGADLSSTRMIADARARERAFVSAASRTSRLIGRVNELIMNLELFTIAGINGFAVGGGWSLALACDYRIVVPQAEFWFPEVDLGLPLGAGTTALITACVGAARAREIIITCRRYRAEELVAIGLLNQVVAEHEFRGAIEAMATRMAQRSRFAVAVSKAQINAAMTNRGLIRSDLYPTE